MNYRPEEIRDKDGKWLNSQVFREEGLKYHKNKYYVLDPEESPAYREYWDEQLRRCKEGYSVGGHKITEHHYAYLNFTEIQLVDDNEDPDQIVKVKETRVPDFWDGDYDYYWSLEIAKNGLLTRYALASTELEKQTSKELPHEQREELKQKILNRLQLRVKPHPDYLEGGNHMIIGKSRRKGYSYKNAAICANVYNTVRKALTIIGAFDKKYLYPEGTMGMATRYLNFFNERTAWAKSRDYVDKQEHKRASFKKTLPNSATVEAGYQSQIMALTFKDNPDAARGKDAKYVLFEEAGKFPNLLDSFEATRDSLSAGKFITGQILIFGTGGDMEVGTVDFAHMFYRPLEYGLMPFVNIWDKDASNTYCGFFHPTYLNTEGFYDDQGNSDIAAAIADEMATREKLVKNASSSLSLQKRVQEHPLSPEEAFLTVSLNDFPLTELRARKALIIREKLHLSRGQAVYLYSEGGQIKMRPDLDFELEPLWDYKPKTKNRNGAVIIYEAPGEKPPKGLYKIGFDPYRQENGESLAAIYVYKSSSEFSYTRQIIVASFIGRPYSPDEVNRIAMMLAELYNAEIMHENEVTHVKDYFRKKKKLNLLARQPDAVINKHILNSQVDRGYGIHMVDKLKDAGEKYIKDWLLEIVDYDEEGKPITNLDNLNDIGLIEELIQYHRKGNFDRVMAFMMIMFQLADEEEGKIYNRKQERNNAKDLLALMNRQFRNEDNPYQTNSLSNFENGN